MRGLRFGGLLAATLFSAGPAAAADITVCSYGCDQPDLPSAVAIAIAGDRLLVSPGTYPVAGLVLDKDLIIQGLDRSTVIVDASGVTGIKATGAHNIEVLELTLTGSATSELMGGELGADVLLKNVDVTAATSIARALDFDATTVLTVTDSAFTDLIGTGSGAAIRTAGALTVNACTFANIDTADGVVRGDPGALLDISGVLFAGNRATTGSAGISIDAGDLYLSDSIFDGNAGVTAATVLTTAGTALLSNNQYRANTALADAGGVNITGPAGALSAQILGGVFDGNAAGEAGGMALDGVVSPVVDGTSFTDNVGKVGGLSIVGGSDPMVSNATFACNRGSNGGGLSIDSVGASTRVENSFFVDNTVTEHGGGVFTTGSVLLVQNGSFLGNSGGMDGEGLYALDGDISLINTLFAYHTAGYGLYLEPAALLSRFDYMGWFDNTPDHAFGAVPTGNDVIADPLLVAYPPSAGCINAGQWDLGPYSPMVDRGDPGMLDPDLSISDIGARALQGLPGTDADGDGDVVPDDCDDNDPTLNLADDDGDGYSTCDGDCEDRRPDISPGAPELCDGLDNDCDGSIGDSWTGGGSTSTTAGAPLLRGNIFEAVDAVEVLEIGATLRVDPGEEIRWVVYESPTENGVYNLVHESIGVSGRIGFDRHTSPPMRVPLTPGMYYGIGVGFDTWGQVYYEAGAVFPADEGFVVVHDTMDVAVWPPPAAASVASGGTDWLELFLTLNRELDGDGDGEASCLDCDDSDPALNHLDLDTDGWDSCTGDCDDLEPERFPGNPEVCDGLDNDCDGSLGNAAWVSSASGSAASGFDLARGNVFQAINPVTVTGIGFGLQTNPATNLRWLVYESATLNGTYDLIADIPDVSPGSGWHSSPPMNVPLTPGLYYAIGLAWQGWGQYTFDPAPPLPSDLGFASLQQQMEWNGFPPPIQAAVAPGLLQEVQMSLDFGGSEVDGDLDGFAECLECDDTDPLVFPGALEVPCDGVDNDCDPYTLDDTDNDADGDGSCTDCDDYDPGLNTLDQDGDGFSTCAGDCDDNDPSAVPGAAELACDGVDNDCDPYTLDDADLDGDGVGVCADCDDNDPAVFPGAAELTCDGLDNDCDGLTPDELDLDGDGVGDCTDCDDGDPGIYPGAAEIPCDGIDNDCDPYTLDDADLDGDGVGVCADCDDNDPAVFPGAAELTCDGLDNDCDGLTPDELDLDGDGVGDCTDCDDGDPGIYPGAAEIPCDGIDNDCDPYTVDDLDSDGDGWTTCGGDCDDGNAAVNPGAGEICDPLDIDEDCNGLADDADPGVSGQSALFTDGDGDGFGLDGTALNACDSPPGYADAPGDCDDGNPAVNPDAQEICSGVDEDCDGLIDDDDPDAPGSIWFPDADGDGFGDSDAVGSRSCEGGPGMVVAQGDCDDSDPERYPGAPETPYDGVDSDCDGLDPDDLDLDGFAGGAAGEDCDDNDDQRYPGAPDAADDGVDQDCSGADAQTVYIGAQGVCGCDQGGGPMGAWWALLGLAALRRRSTRR